VDGVGVTNLSVIDLSALILIVTTGISVPIAAITPISRLKGRLRLAGSCLAGSGIFIEGLTPITRERLIFRSMLCLGAGVFLIWVGLRKYRRDPEGRTQPRQIL